MPDDASNSLSQLCVKRSDDGEGGKVAAAAEDDKDDKVEKTEAGRD
jgi:hypothetical protein